MVTDLNDLSGDERLWLNLLSTYFNVYYNKPVKYREIHTTLSKLLPDCSNELWCLITNVARSLKHMATGLRIPRDFYAYKGNSQKIRHAKILKVLDTLEQEGYLNYYRGGLIGMSADTTQTSIYVPTPKFLVMWKGVEVVDKTTIVGVQIRDRLLRECLSTKGHKGVADMQEFVAKYNTLLLSTEIAVSGVSLPVQQYTRIFSDNVSRGGRYYNSSGGVQTMPSNLRRYITINGEDTVELDFKALHPNILYEYAEKELGIPLNMSDPYEIDCSDIVCVDWSIVKEGNNPIRNLIKQVMLRALNARNIAATIPTVTSNWYEEVAKGKDSAYYGLTSCAKDGKFPAKVLCMRIAEHHKIIKDAFFSDVGLLLQKVDSDIITIVLQKFTDTGVCALSEHDSVIVPKQYAELAYNTMCAAYKEIIGSDTYCKIERK